MESEFITTRSRITVKNKWLTEKEIVPRPESYWFFHFLLLLLLIIYSVEQIFNDRVHKIIRVLICIAWISPHFTRIYRILFVQVWRTSIPLKEVKYVEREEEYNELEEKVTVTLVSGRKKTYLFRRSEKQAAGFVAALNASIGFHSIALQ